MRKIDSMAKVKYGATQIETQTKHKNIIEKNETRRIKLFFSITPSNKGDMSYISSSTQLEDIKNKST